MKPNSDALVNASLGELSYFTTSFVPLFLLFTLSFVAMTRKERYQFVIDYFEKHSPEAETELIYDNPYELLVDVILSAQCTDKRVNETTPALFRIYPDVKSLSKATFDDVFPFIKSIS